MANKINFTNIAYDINNSNSVNLEVIEQCQAVVVALINEKNKQFEMLEKETQEKTLAKDPDYRHAVSWTETVIVGHGEYSVRDMFRLLAKEHNIRCVNRNGDEQTNVQALVDALVQYCTAYARGHNRKEKLVTKKPQIFVGLTNMPIFYIYDVAMRHVDGVKEGLNPLQHLASRNTQLRDALKPAKTKREGAGVGVGVVETSLPPITETIAALAS